MGLCTPFYPEVPKVLVHVTDSHLWEHFGSWGSLAPGKALTLHCTAREDSTNPALSQASSLVGLSPQGMGLESSSSPRIRQTSLQSSVGGQGRWHWEPSLGGFSSKPVCCMERLTMAGAGIQGRCWGCKNLSAASAVCPG